MTNLKPKVFIGSSTPGLKVAENVEDNLSSSFECFLWNDPNIWEENVSNFHNLLRMVAFFDFGVFVATADDLTIIDDKNDKKIVIEPRDNVILEMSLFVGAMGRGKSFLLVEEGIKLPSDFNGIVVNLFRRNDRNSIIGACHKVIDKIHENSQLAYLTLYPTTSLAINYFMNYIYGLVENISKERIAKFYLCKRYDFILKIVLPNDLKGSVNEKAAHFYIRHGFKEKRIRTKYRRQSVWLKPYFKREPKKVFYNMPSTLSGIGDAIEMILSKDFYGRTKMQELIEQRELNNFRKVLQMKIDENPFAKLMVEIIDEF
jgi:hypothetical protein